MDNQQFILKQMVKRDNRSFITGNELSDLDVSNLEVDYIILNMDMVITLDTVEIAQKIMQQ